MCYCTFVGSTPSLAKDIYVLIFFPPRMTPYVSQIKSLEEEWVRY
jgi:hypothetical protein